MQAFHYVNGRLCAENVPLADIAGDFGTPVYVYSRAAIEERWRSYDAAFDGRDHLVCYAVKANGNLAVLDLLARLGSGFDIVSGGELQRVLRAGGRADRVVFSGVGKTRTEMQMALAAGIKCFNLESRAELALLDAVAAEAGVRAPVSVRVNPDVDAETHPYIATGLKESKFGIDIAEARDVYAEAGALQNIDVVGIDCHIGSQIISLDPFQNALERIMALVAELEGVGMRLRHIDLGGGLGIRYRDEDPPDPAALVRALCEAIPGAGYQLLIEPGRSIVGPAGVLLTSVLFLKDTGDKHFAVADAAMNDLMRPALYDAWQDILPVATDTRAQPQLYDVVGPVCESGDFLGRGRQLALQEGDLLAVSGAGAYGFCMSSNYNARPRAAEVMVAGKQVFGIRERESLDDLMRGEELLPPDP
jgi:diaminopimelate decarboxylase